MNIEYTFTINNDKSQIIRQFEKKTGRQRARKVVYQETEKNKISQKAKALEYPMNDWVI